MMTRRRNWHHYTPEEDEFIITTIKDSDKMLKELVRDIIYPQLPHISINALLKRCSFLISKYKIDKPKALRDRRAFIEKKPKIESERFLSNSARYFSDLKKAGDRDLLYVVKPKSKNVIGPNIHRPLWFNDTEELIKRASGCR